MPEKCDETARKQLKNVMGRIGCVKMPCAGKDFSEGII